MTLATDILEGRPEISLLLTASRVVLGQDAVQNLHSLVCSEFDWYYFQRLLNRHGVLPLVFSNFKRYCPREVPTAFFQKLGERFEQNRLRNFFFAAELLKLADLFTDQGIEILTFKGPVLAVDAYQDLALRQFGDLDLLLKERDFGHACELLLKQGYQVAYPLNVDQQNAFVRARAQLPFCSLTSGTAVEMHLRVFPPFFRFEMDHEPLWTRIRPIPLLGRAIHTFAVEDLLLILCVHGAKHHWSALGWICDLHELIRTHAFLDWDRVLGQAKVCHGKRMLLLGLCLVQDLFQVCLPDMIVREVQADSHIAILEAQIFNRLHRDRAAMPSAFESCRFQLRLRERWRDGVQYSIYLALAPTPADEATLPLPQFLSGLYYVLRPARLILKYLLTWLQGIGRRS